MLEENANPPEDRPKALTAAASRPERPVQHGIPVTKAQRDRLLGVIREYVGRMDPVPPLSLEELHLHAENVVRLAAVGPECRKYAAVLLNNEVWRETLAGVPYRRRLLLLPQCLRDKDHCQAELDEFGLLCKHCRRCCIHDLQTEAEALGYVVLVAEGATLVSSLIQKGRIDAVVGVSCLSVLEQVFPHVEAAAVPGIAIPLLQEGCADTRVDLDWVWEAIYLTGEDKTRRLDLGALRGEVESWFAPESLAALLGRPGSQTERIAHDWLARSGKRWRPFLAVCAFQAFQEDPAAPLPEDLRNLAVAVECFHKASLAHDDIEDGDEFRYGRKALHAEHGVPIALNAGDFLLGEGYRMIAACGAPPERRAKMLQVAAEGHRRLCLGQGAELCWRRSPGPMSSEEVIEIFRHKTAPAFDVALRLGAAHAGAGEGLWRMLGEYSDAVGIAYQIRDDIRDASGQGDPGGVLAARPSLLLAMAWERATGQAGELLQAAWRTDAPPPKMAAKIAEVFADLGVVRAAGGLLERYKRRAIRSLHPLENANLKGLLRRVVGKIFDEIESMGCCREYKAGNAADRQVGAEPAG